MKQKADKGKVRRRKRNTEPVEVSARIRQLDEDDANKCIKVINENTLRLTGPPPERRSMNCQFSDVFDEVINQKILFENVACPMIEDLIDGKNGLLFTYGVTNSGKTYTMTGTVEEPGILPRSLDMLFNSIGDLQTSKYIFVPDGMNGFQIQTEADALQCRQNKDIMFALTSKKTHKYRPKNLDIRYDLEHRQSKNVKHDHRYAVFVSYVEIYNDTVYDLLGEMPVDQFGRAKTPPSLRLRENRQKNMYVYDSTEIEIKTTEEAFSLLQQGQERKRIANTQLNTESSRSHSILSIRLVQAPLDPMGEDLLRENCLIRTSQLSLVDLAGSERSSRTGAYKGRRLQEAGTINCSLMNLRRCLEQLRSNQQNGASEMVKYRNSKLTHLFKSFFEGHGKVKMVVCINPGMDEYEENVHVMQFAEIASHVEVPKSDRYAIDKEAVKRKLKEIEEKKARYEMERKRRDLNSHQNGKSLRHLTNSGKKHRVVQESSSEPSTPSTESSDDVFVDVKHFDYSVVEDLPNFEILDVTDSKTIPNLVSFLRKRIKSYDRTKNQTMHMRKLFRANLSKMTVTDRELSTRLKEVEAELNKTTKDVEKFERQVRKLESKNQVLSRTTKEFESQNRALMDQVNEANVQVRSSETDVRRLESQMRIADANTRAQLEKMCQKRIRSAQTEAQEKMWAKDERIRQLKNIFEGRDVRPALRTGVNNSASTSSSSSTPARARLVSAPQSHQSQSHQPTPNTPVPTPRERKTPRSLAQTPRSSATARGQATPRSLNVAQTPRSLPTSRGQPTPRYQAQTPKITPRSQPTPRTTARSKGTSRSYVSSALSRKIDSHRAADAGISDAPKVSSRSRRSQSAEPSNNRETQVKTHETMVQTSEIHQKTSLHSPPHRYVPSDQPPMAKHRRSASIDVSNWLAHLPETTIPTETIFQPRIRPKKVVNVPGPKDIAGAQKYVLTHQKECNGGEIETQLYKGEIFQTRTGGQQVQFVDVETLAQDDPKSPQNQNTSSVLQRKRKSPAPIPDTADEMSEQSSWTDVETRCAFGIGNPKKSKN